MENINILTGIRKMDYKWSPSLMGYIHVYDNNRYMYELTTKVKRTTKRDAIKDAEDLKQYILNENGIIAQ